MKQYTVQADFQNLKKGDRLLRVPGFIDPIPFATELELVKQVPSNFWFLSFITSHPEIFKEVDQ